MKQSWALLAVTYLVRHPYIALAIRIRQWGHLPAKRGPTVLITNHQFMDEGEIITGRTFLRHPWKPLLMCNSRRTFETGFIAARLPWSMRFTRRLNLSGLWARYGVLPIENHLFSRPLISVAEELRAAHGDLPLATILPAEEVTRLRLEGRSLSDLWKLENFMLAQEWVKITRLNQPYRREVVENLRAVTKSDVAAIVECVRGGATFYVTPEGDFSADGRMHSMRGGIVDALAPFADLWFCAVAYDPLQGGRLPMLFRVVRYDGAAEIGASLAAARPITTSALLGTFLYDRTESFTIEDATSAVCAQLDALPSNVFVDPELRKKPRALVHKALKAMRKRGTLIGDDGGYSLTAERRDPRFPHVADMVAFQRNMLEETLASAEALRGA